MLLSCKNEGNPDICGSIMLGEKSQTEKDKYGMISPICGI